MTTDPALRALRTEAGRALVKEWRGGQPYMLDRVLAIEAEALATAEAAPPTESYRDGYADGYAQAAERYRAEAAPLDPRDVTVIGGAIGAAYLEGVADAKAAEAAPRDTRDIDIYAQGYAEAQREAAEATPLDVERLARAMTGIVFMDAASNRRLASAIARNYSAEADTETAEPTQRPHNHKVDGHHWQDCPGCDDVASRDTETAGEAG